MPVHTRRNKRGKFDVVDNKGKVHHSNMSREKAKDAVTAMNISMGHVPGLKPKKDKK